MSLEVYRPLSRIFPHFCGLTKDEREKRILAAFEYVAFVDDSGNSPSEPRFVLAAWVATVPAWQRFTRDWNDILKAEPAIKYFKHNEAVAFKECFAGFSTLQADEKCRQLLGVILRHDIYGAVSTIRHDTHKEFIQNKIFKLKPRLPPYLKRPFDLSFYDIIIEVLKIHLHQKWEGKVDFIFDDHKKGSKAIRRCVKTYYDVRTELEAIGHASFPAMGTVTPGDDKEFKPLQAADYLAGQVRAGYLYGIYPAPLRKMAEARLITSHKMDADYLMERFVNPMNRMFIERHGDAGSRK